MRRDALLHVCRTHRVVTHPRGSMLLVGISGSGRRSVARLATFMAEQICFEVKGSRTYRHADFREDVKRLHWQA